MSSLQAHLEQHELLVGALAFRRDCPICRVERVQGQLPSATLVPRRACAAVTAAVLATSAVAPGIAAATDGQGVAAPAPESPPPPQVSEVEVGGGAVAPASGGSSAHDEPSADATEPSDRGARPDPRAHEPESGAGAPAHDEPDRSLPDRGSGTRGIYRLRQRVPGRAVDFSRSRPPDVGRPRRSPTTRLGTTHPNRPRRPRRPPRRPRPHRCRRTHAKAPRLSGPRPSRRALQAPAPAGRLAQIDLPARALAARRRMAAAAASWNARRRRESCPRHPHDRRRRRRAG